MNESENDIVRRFQHIYIGDSLIHKLSLDFQEMRCILLMSSVSRLKDEANPSIFDPAERYAPAVLIFDDMRSIACPQGAFYLNATVVEFEAVAERNGGVITFRMVMTGGFDNETFMRALVIEAKSFSFGPVPDE